ncbi:MAG: hypothetical protein NVSMB25_19840 [Thermoleophilaceae bacterium]
MRSSVAVSRTAALLGALIVLAAALRLWRIDHQSFWLDEAFTAGLVGRGFGPMLATIPASESTPPLYYVLAWLWTHIFGRGEAGLRSLSALFGTLTVPVAFLAARELFNRRAALLAAALVAVNPYFVWYSQEARAYALLVLLAAASLVLLGRLLGRPSGRDWLLWGVVAVSALATHYFAVFLLAPEAVWILHRHRTRAAVLAVAAPLLAAVALTPLALEQRDSGHTRFIAAFSLARRVADLPKKFVTGELGAPVPVLGVAAGLLAAGGVVLAIRRPAQRHNAMVLLSIAAAAGAVPLVLALVGADYLLARNLIALYVPLAIVVAGGFAAVRGGVVAALALCLTALAIDTAVAYNPKLERDDWRGAARALGPARTRAIVLTPDVARTPLALYVSRLEPLAAAGAEVREVDVIGGARPARFGPPPAPAGFHATTQARAESYMLIRYEAPVAQRVLPSALAASRLGSKPAAILVQR